MTAAATDLNAARRKHNADAALLVLFNAARRSVEAGADPGEAIRRHVAAPQGPVAGRLRAHRDRVRRGAHRRAERGRRRPRPPASSTSARTSHLRAQGPPRAAFAGRGADRPPRRTP